MAFSVSESRVSDSQKYKRINSDTLVHDKYILSKEKKNIQRQIHFE